MNSFYSEISGNMIARLAREPMAPRELIRFLEEGAQFRTFADVLRRACPEEDMVSRLTDGLVRITDGDYASVSRRVRNWLNGSSVPKNREQLFQICFALGLGEETADQLLASADESGIHYRDPKELVYAFALRTGREYDEAQELYGRMRKIYEAGSEEQQEKHEQPLRYTRQLRDAFLTVDTTEELEQFFYSYRQDLGELHETAYRKFVELLNCLQEPEAGAERYSLERVEAEYLRMHVPHTRVSGDFSCLQKVIKRHWPGESDLLKMKNRSVDVSRKALLLLLLVTEDFETGGGIKSDGQGRYYDLCCEELEESPAEKLEVRLRKLNLFLDDYGMNLLDPRSPFDCLLLYALGAQCGEQGICENFEAALEVLFEDQNAGEAHGLPGAEEAFRRDDGAV